VNVAAHAAFNAWSRYVAAIVASVVIALGVWLGQHLRLMRR